MYKILVCDDEKWIRKGAIAKIQYHEFNFEQIYEAADGKEALEIIKDEKPHIVITDVKMPNMTGIDLLKKTKELYPEIKFIIISGYAEFEYVQEAINLGAKGYILKPIVDDNLVSNLNKVIDELNLERKISSIISSKQELAKINEEYKLEFEVNEVMNLPEDISYNYEQSAIFKFMKADSKYMMALISIPIDETLKSLDTKLIKDKLLKLLKKNMVEDNAIVVNNANDIYQIFVISSGSSELKLKKSFEEYVTDSVSEIRKMLNIQLIVSLSGITGKLSSLMYKQARSADELRIINNSKWLYRYSDLDKNKSKYFDYPEQKLKVLGKCIEDGDSKNACKILRDIFSFNETQVSNFDWIHFLLSECVNMLVKVCNKKEIEVTSIIPYKLLTVDKISNYRSLDTILEDISMVIASITDSGNGNNYNARDVIAKSKKYIDEHYGEELTVNALAQRFLINPNYLSNLFSKEIGFTITKYITKMRLEKACELLEETSINISDISSSVGYQDPQYFYRVFKKEMNMTPAEYRSRNLNN
jgi:two-component system, response regulator YesN